VPLPGDFWQDTTAEQVDAALRAGKTLAWVACMSRVNYHREGRWLVCADGSRLDMRFYGWEGTPEDTH